MAPAIDALTDDPLDSFWQQIYDAVMPIFGPIILFAPIFFGLLGNTWQFFLDTYAWIASLFGVDPFPDAVDGLGSGLPDIDAAGAIDPALSAEFSTTVGDVTSLFSDAAAPLESTDLVDDLGMTLDPGFLTTELSAVLDPSVITDLGAAIDPAEIADIGTLLTG